MQILGQQVLGTASKHVSSDPDYRYRQRRQIRVHKIESGLSGQIIKTQVMLVGQTWDYGSANSRSEGYVQGTSWA